MARQRVLGTAEKRSHLLLGDLAPGMSCAGAEAAQAAAQPSAGRVSGRRVVGRQRGGHPAVDVARCDVAQQVFVAISGSQPVDGQHGRSSPNARFVRYLGRSIAAQRNGPGEADRTMRRSRPSRARSVTVILPSFGGIAERAAIRVPDVPLSIHLRSDGPRRTSWRHRTLALHVDAVSAASLSQVMQCVHAGARGREICGPADGDLSSLRVSDRPACADSVVTSDRGLCAVCAPPHR